MLSKALRVNLKTDFKRIVKGKRIETPLFKLYYLISDTQQTKLGISLSKKELNKAHDRNRARRIISQLIQNLYSDLPKGMNLIIIPKAAILEKNPDELSQQLRSVLIK